MPKPNKALSRWLDAATPEERKTLAKLADTSVKHLSHLAHGRRVASAALAQRLAHAAKTMPLNPELNQVDLCPACLKCPLLNGR